MADTILGEMTSTQKRVPKSAVAAPRETASDDGSHDDESTQETAAGESGGDVETTETKTDIETSGNASPEAKQDRGLKQAAIEERKKRQDLEQRYREMERENAYLKGRAAAQPDTQAAKQPTREEMDEFFWKEGPSAYYQKYSQQFGQQQNIDPIALKIEMSDSFAEQQIEGYRETRQAFIDAAGKNPYLLQQLRAVVQQGGNAALFVHQQGKILSRAAGVTDIDEYDSKLREKHRKEFEEELQKSNRIIPTTGTARATSQGGSATLHERATLSAMASGNFV